MILQEKTWLHRVLKWRSTLGMKRRRFSAILAVAAMKSANSLWIAPWLSIARGTNLDSFSERLLVSQWSSLYCVYKYLSFCSQALSFLQVGQKYKMSYCFDCEAHFNDAERKSDTGFSYYASVQPSVRLVAKKLGQFKASFRRNGYSKFLPKNSLAFVKRQPSGNIKISLVQSEFDKGLQSILTLVD